MSRQHSRDEVLRAVRHNCKPDELRYGGHRSIKVGDTKILELKVHNTAVAAPGCAREDGKEYIIKQDLPLVELPTAWIEWITAHTTERKSSTLRKLHPDFDAESLANHFDWEFVSELEKAGALYYVFAECPLAERMHTDQESPPSTGVPPPRRRISSTRSRCRPPTGCSPPSLLLRPR